MPSYNAPGVYIHDVVNGSQTVNQLSSSVGVLIGKTRSGILGVAQKITSWTEFISKYANGLDTPFIENSFLPYSAYGFFQNGGQELYIVSVKNSAVKATGTSEKILVTAANEGVWGNDLKVTIKKNVDYTDTNKSFDVIVTLGTSDSVTITDVTVSTIVDAVNNDSTLKAWFSSFSLVSGTTALAEETISFSGGTDGSALADADYIEALGAIDFLSDVTFVAVPGQTSATVNKAILSYCDAHELFPIIDAPIGSSAEDVKAYRKTISAFTGALAYPWGKVTDPLTNSLKSVPTAGHLMGVYARIVESRGVFKAPAGIDAVVTGFVEMETRLTQAQIATLNPLGVICIISKPNAGIVVWGARSLNDDDPTMRYVSDGLLNLNIKRSLYEGTQFSVFEPNNEDLRSRLETACVAFLENLRAQGAFKGEGDDAYYVTVNSSNNNEETSAEGLLNIEVGYAPVKPAEFVVIKLSHSIVSGT